MEEGTFYEINQDLINRKRELLDKKRREEYLQNRNQENWLKCPKCFSEMVEEKLEGVMIDHCTGCDGLFFDKGELELLIDAKEKKHFFQSIHKKFYN